MSRKFVFQYRGFLTFCGLDMAVGGYHGSLLKVGGGFLVAIVVIATGRN